MADKLDKSKETQDQGTSLFAEDAKGQADNGSVEDLETLIQQLNEGQDTDINDTPPPKSASEAIDSAYESEDEPEAKETSENEGEPEEPKPPQEVVEPEEAPEEEEEVDDDSAWYVVHTFSGYENKVQEGLELMIEYQGLSDKIKEVQIPTRTVTEEKNGKMVATKKKLFPGYVIVRMIMDDDTWYLVRNQRGVTGFVGPNGQKPIPLTKQELDNMGVIKLDKKAPLFMVGDPIEVVDGALKGEVTVIEEVLEDTKEVRIRTSILGTNTSTLVGFDKIRKIEV